MSDSIRIALLPGDGIGPEVIEAARQVAGLAAGTVGVSIEWEEHPFGGAAIDAAGEPFPESTRAACMAADAILLGAIGGPAWDGIEPERRPEKGLLSLRQSLGAFANLRPVQVPGSLAHLSVLPQENVAGTDLLVVRELTGGIYFGEPRQYSEEEAFDTMRYTAEEVDRIARVAFDSARQRSGRIVSVDKANVLASSRLWRHRVTRLHETEYGDVALDHLYVDNAAMQLVRDPKAFDVILTANLFGDILSDLASTLAGSLGVLPSASVGGTTPLFEPVHGSAPDLAGQNKANPVAAMLSAAMLFDTVGYPKTGTLIRRAVDATLAAGHMTADLAVDGVSTSAFTDRVCQQLETIELPLSAI
jgi:3-isopropylmalate dehydrogenase